MTGAASISIRVADSTEYAAIGALTEQVYVGEGHTEAGSDYVAELRDVAARAAETDVLVATDPLGQLLGAVALALPGSAYAELGGPGEAEFRMLAVAPEARGRGVGRALVAACVARARAAGCARMVLSTQAEMAAAHRLYGTVGFRRAPERDWRPYPELTLLAFELEL